MGFILTTDWRVCCSFLLQLAHHSYEYSPIDLHAIAYSDHDWYYLLEVSGLNWNATSSLLSAIHTRIGLITTSLHGQWYGRS